MTKTQLKKWIETQKNKALNEARKIYLQKLSEHEENIYKEMGLYELEEVLVDIQVTLIVVRNIHLKK
ncbi:hypothetical protein ACR77J_15835 [Tissierella praeacuta]|uniref:hypothetical protein n=1 Tax=Tissierella praeacuta TaxID=43131 RepID=UPI003DA5E63D